MMNPEKVSKWSRWLLYLSPLVPIVLIPGFFFPFVSTRGLFFRAVIALGLAAFIWLFATREVKWGSRRDLLLIALGVFVAAQALAGIFSLAPWRSFFGDYERMWGVWAYAYLLAYYMLLRTFLDDSAWIRLL